MRIYFRNTLQRNLWKPFPSQSPRWVGSQQDLEQKWFRLVRGRILLVLGIIGLLGLLETLRVLVGNNFHTVVPGQCYRSGQLHGEALAYYVRTYGIRTVVNLRGSNPSQEWYVQECQLLKQLGVQQIDVESSASSWTREPEFHKLIHALESAPRPLLLHCYNGSDRTGMASTAFLLLNTSVGLEEALGQLHVRYGHFTMGNRRAQEEIFDLYRDYLQARQVDHSSDHFRIWAMRSYEFTSWIPRWMKEAVPPRNRF